ncbi:MAG: VOC family protein [Rhodospirillaceae bacterium]|nr:VOC family protein [Rhodospirillaceae bacterium]
MPVSQMVRAALMVSDLEKSREFYTNVLGLTEVYSEGVAKGGNMHALIGMPDSITTRVCILKVPGKPAYGMVGLFEVKDPAPPKIQRQNASSNVGEFCIVFYCDNLDPVHEQAKKRGLTIVSPPVPLHVRGHVKQREMTIRGLDGEKINLIEWDIAKADAGDRPEKWPGVPEK